MFGATRLPSRTRRRRDSSKKRWRRGVFTRHAAGFDQDFEAPLSVLRVVQSALRAHRALTGHAELRLLLRLECTVLPNDWRPDETHDRSS